MYCRPTRCDETDAYNLIDLIDRLIRSSSRCRVPTCRYLGTNVVGKYTYIIITGQD